jgi:hypothetical protein
VKDKTTGNQQHGLAPFDMSHEIPRRQSWDVEATSKEIAATEMEQIKKLQNTRGKELSGVHILAHFMRIHVQPIQARPGPLWLYSSAGHTARISKDIPVKDLEKLVRCFTSLSKKDEVPASCRVKQFNGAHALLAVSKFYLFFLPNLPFTI